MIIDPKGLPPDVARLLSALNAAPLPNAPNVSVPAALTSQADVAEFSSLLQAPAELQQNQVALAKLATAVSYNQAFDGMLLRLQKVLERMLAIAELAQNPATSPEQRAAYTAEFALLQRTLTGLETKPLPSREALPTPMEEQFHRLYGVPLEGGWKRMAEKVRSEDERQRLRRLAGKRCARFPRISVVITASPDKGAVRTSLESVFEQSYPGVECVVIQPENALLDVDTHPEYVRCIARSMEFNIAAACRAAVSEAEGEVLLLMDAGDILLPHSLQTAGTLFLRQAQVEWMAGSAIRISEVSGTTSNSSDQAVNGLGSDRTSAARISRTFWRRSLWERIDGAFGASIPQLSEGELAHLFRQFTPLYLLDLALIAGTSAEDALGSSEPPARSVAQANESLLKAEPVELGENDIFQLDPGEALDSIMIGLERAMREERWEDAAKSARLAAAAEPNNPDVLGLEAVCEFHLGRMAQAGALLHNVTQRFRKNLPPSAQAR